MSVLGIDFAHHLVAFGWLVFGFFAFFLLLLLVRIEVFRMGNAAAIEAVVVQLGKAKDEIVGKIVELEAAVDNGEDLSGPLASLVAAAQALDDVVPDAVADVEGEEEDEEEGDEFEDVDPDFGAAHPE